MENFPREGNQYNPNSRDLKVLSGMFQNRESTEMAYNSLIEKGYSNDQINILMSNKTHDRLYLNIPEEGEVGTKAAEHAGKGSVIGGTVGAIAGVLAAIGSSVVIPGLGILISGPLAAGLAGAGAGGLVGGVIGGLVSSGMPEARAKLYDAGIKEGNVVITVTPKDDADAIYLHDNWRENLGEEVHY